MIHPIFFTILTIFAIYIYTVWGRISNDGERYLMIFLLDRGKKSKAAQLYTPLQRDDDIFKFKDYHFNEKNGRKNGPTSTLTEKR